MKNGIVKKHKTKDVIADSAHPKGTESENIENNII
jgi:hypothetical protein